MKMVIEIVNEPAKCPNCHDNEGVAVGELDLMAGKCVTQEMKCEQCGSTWEDVFTLAGFRKVTAAQVPMKAGEPIV